jgi:uncharacterized protein YukE
MHTSKQSVIHKHASTLERLMDHIAKAVKIGSSGSITKQKLQKRIRIPTYITQTQMIHMHTSEYTVMHIQASTLERLMDHIAKAVKI